MRRVVLLLLCAALLLGIAPGVSAASDVKNDASDNMAPALILLVVLLGVLVIACIIFTVLLGKHRDRSRVHNVLLVGAYLVTAYVLVCTLVCTARYRNQGDPTMNVPSSSTTVPSSSETKPTVTEPTGTEPTDPPTTAPVKPPEPIPTPEFVPERTPDVDPGNWNVKWDIISGDSVVGSYNRPEQIEFGGAHEYAEIEGVTTFRGDNYRSGATFGTATVTQQKLSEKWNKGISSLSKWTGCGWTGQPLIVRWDDETKAIMNLRPEKKEKDGLVEVIYATLDGNIYFYDLEDGSYTRDPLFIGMSFKGAGTLDPRGYPLMYVGSGDNRDGKAARMYIISLIDGSILFEQTGRDSFAKRNWYAFDSAPLVDAETDTLIWPGENGVLYTMDLNTEYDKQAGTISVSPKTAAKTRYTTKLDRTVGYESSVIAVGGYLFVSDNGGMLYCVDVNTMKLVWALNIKDDMNATPVFEWGEDGKGYLYFGTSMEYAGGTSYLYKLDAATGRIIWEKTYSGIVYDKNVSGGVLSSPILGKKGTELEGMILFSISKTPRSYGGILVALDTETGEVIWENELKNYAWSSPVAVYTEDGDAYVILCDSAGKAMLMDGPTGTVLDTVSLGSNVEASPAVFGDTLVVGTRGQRVYALKIS